MKKIELSKKLKKQSGEYYENIKRLPKCIECGDAVKQTDALCTKSGYICDHCIEDLRREVLLEW